MGGQRAAQRPAIKNGGSNFSRVQWSRAAQAGLVSILRSVSSCTGVIEGAHGSISPAGGGAPPFPHAGRSALGFAYSARLPLPRARLRKSSRRRRLDSDSCRAGGNGSSALEKADGAGRTNDIVGRHRPAAARKLAVSMGLGEAAERGRREEPQRLRRLAQSSETVLTTVPSIIAARRESGVQRLECSARGRSDGGAGGGGGRSRVALEARAAMAVVPAPTEEVDTAAAAAAAGPGESEWEAVLRERLERKLRKPNRKRRARRAAAAATASGAPASSSASPHPVSSSTSTQSQQHDVPARTETETTLATDPAVGYLRPQPSAARAEIGNGVYRQRTKHAEGEEEERDDINRWREARGRDKSEASTTSEVATRTGGGRRSGTGTEEVVAAGRSGVGPPPLKRRPPGGPFGASKAVAWHAQQVVQSAVTPMQAMRAVLDRPLRSNFVTVSTAVNRVAKLAAERRRGGGLKGDDEPKYLGILLKVTEELVDADLVNARNLAQLLWSLAKLGNPTEALSLSVGGDGDGRREEAAQLLQHPEKGLPDIGPLRFGRGVGGEEEAAAMASGVPSIPDQGRLPSLLAGKLSQRTMECKPQELAMAAWGLAVLGERDENLLSAIGEEVPLRAADFQGKELANIVWAFAVLDYRDTKMLDAIAQVLSPEPLSWQGRVSWEWKTSPRTDSNDEREMSGGFWKATIDKTWALKLPGGPPPARPAAMVMAEKARTSAEAEKRRVATAAEGSGGGKARLTAGVGNDGGDGLSGSTGVDGGVDGGSSPIRGDASVPSPPSPAESGVGAAGGGPPPPPSPSRGHWSCASEVEVGSVVLAPQELAMLSWAFSSLAQKCLPCQPAAYRALAVLAKGARQCVGNFRPQDISMMSLALARMSWDDPPLMKAMAARTTETLRAFKPQELSNTAWAYARLSEQDPRFWVSVQKQAKRMLDGPGMKAQEIANLAWALAVMGDSIAETALLRDLLTSAQAQRLDLGLIESHQLYQVYLLWGKDMPELWEEIDVQFLKGLKRRWTDNQQRTKRSSFSHLEVSKTLDLMQISHENESEHDIDIEVVGVGLASEDWDFRSFSAGKGPNPADPAEVRLKLALEVDGPAHFTKNTAMPLGHMVLKHRTLSKMGWTVVSIPFLEWDPIPFWSSMEKKRYLQRKLGITRTIFFGGTDCSQYKGWSTRLGKPSRFS